MEEQRSDKSDGISQKSDRRKFNGALPGQNNGGGPKANIQRLVENAKEEGYKIAKAEFWVNLAEKYAVPRLLAILENGKDDVSLRACQELLNRAMGKPKESIDHTTNGKELNQVVSIQYLAPHEDPSQTNG